LKEVEAKKWSMDNFIVHCRKKNAFIGSIIGVVLVHALVTGASILSRLKKKKNCSVGD